MHGSLEVCKSLQRSAGVCRGLHNPAEFFWVLLVTAEVCRGLFDLLICDAVCLGLWRSEGISC